MLLFDIKRYAVNNRPGVCVMIFMGGCPLVCVWCHNPEGISPWAEKLYTRKKCVGCGACMDVCPTGALTLTEAGIVTDRSLCRTCGGYAEACPTLAMEASSREYSTDEVIHEIKKETVFMGRSEGGATLYGGGPLSHPSGLVALLDRRGALGIHRTVGTALFVSPDTVHSVVEHTGLFLVDLRRMDSDSRCCFTGVPNKCILSDPQMIIETGIDFLICIPLIEGISVDEEGMSRSAAFLVSLPRGWKVAGPFPYHDVGEDKHGKRGALHNPGHLPLSAPPETVLQRCIDQLASCGMTASIGE